MQTLADSETQTDDPLEARAMLLAEEYESVFGEPPDLECVVSQAGVDSLVVSGWLWLYRSDDAADRWSVRILLPGDPWFRKFECMASRDGYTVEKPSLDDAIVYLFQHEAHRRCHLAREFRSCRR